MVRRLTSAIAAIAVLACPVHASAKNASNNATVVSWPDSLKVVGNGFPKTGDPCRVIGETAATVDFLDDSATLAGCATPEQAAALGGKILTKVDGITLVSVPFGASPTAPGDESGQGDSKVSGTDYNATVELPCSGIKGGGPTCKAGVTRMAESIAIDIILPGNKTRTLLFDGKGAFITHRSAEADGSAALQSSGRREADWTIVRVGLEQYRVSDAFVLGD